MTNNIQQTISEAIAEYVEAVKAGESVTIEEIAEDYEIKPEILQIRINKAYPDGIVKIVSGRSNLSSEKRKKIRDTIMREFVINDNFKLKPYKQGDKRILLIGGYKRSKLIFIDCEKQGLFTISQRALSQWESAGNKISIGEWVENGYDF